MGKTKNKKRKVKKLNPIGLPSVRDMEREEEELGCLDEDGPGTGCGGEGDHAEATIETDLQSLIDKIQSVNVEDKECACCNLALLVENHRAIPVILEKNIVKMIAPLLLDPSCVVRHAAAGSLRNLSACGGYDVCEAMVEQDIMTPVVALFRQYPDDWTPYKNKEGKMDTRKEIFVEATHLLWNLCESSSVALATFNRENLLPILVRCLNPPLYGNSLAIAVAQCLHTVTEDNPEAICFLNQTGILEILDTVICREWNGMESMLLKVLASGILLNMNDSKLSGCSPSQILAVMHILSHTLGQDSTPSITVLIDRLNARMQKGKGGGGGVDAKDVAEDQEIALMKADIDNMLSAQTVALEILTNIACCDDGSECWEDVDNSDASDDINDVSMDDFSLEQINLNVPLEIHEAIASNSMVQKVFARISVPTDAVKAALMKNPSVVRPLLKRLTTLQCRALLCMNNLVTSLDKEDLGDPNYLFDIWVMLGQLAFKHTAMCPPKPAHPAYCNTQTHVELSEAATSAMRAVLKVQATLCPSRLDQAITQADVQVMFEVAQQSTEAGLRTNIINIVGTLGCVMGRSRESLAANPNATSVIKSIGLFLIDLCSSKDTELSVMAESLDAIFDVFGEEHVDAIVLEICLLDRLKQTLPLLRNKIAQQRKTVHRDQNNIVKTAKENLVRFIPYLEKRAASCK